jgi:uncharacterized protein YhaN
MGYTLGEAAKATGKTKSAISKAIKNGKISAALGENGGYNIDPSELHRVYPPKPGIPESQPSTGIPQVNPGLPLENVELRAKLEASEQRLRDAQEQVMDLRRRLDQSEEERRKTQTQLTALLTDQRQKPEEPPSGFWKRLLG